MPSGIITTYPGLRLLVISGFISSNRRAKLSARGRRLLSLSTRREWIDDNCSPLTPLRSPTPQRKGCVVSSASGSLVQPELLSFQRAIHGANRTLRNFGPQHRPDARSRASHHHSMVRVVRDHFSFLDLLWLVLGHLLAHDHRARHFLDSRAPADSIRRHPRRGHLHVSDFFHHVLS